MEFVLFRGWGANDIPGGVTKGIGQNYGVHLSLCS